MMDEIILIDKPAGITSFDVIRQLRRKLGIKKMGHGGTLDPLASGLMIIAVGKETKRLNEFLKLPKVYEAEVLLGISTTTGDLEGNIVEEKEVKELDPKKIRGVLDAMVGKIILPVPLYSAIKVGGKRLYKTARQGEKAPELPKREMEIFWIKLIGENHLDKEFSFPAPWLVISLELEVASGTYIRSIAEELGRRLGYPATIKSLRRTRIGQFSIDQAEQL